MKNIFTIVITSVVTVLLTLVVLWKFGWTILETVDKGEKLLGKDKVSQLLAREYPRLGEDLEKAYQLFPEVKFESKGQTDFKIDDDEEIYVIYKKHLDRNRITSMKLYLSGKKENIRRLGEKLLPEGSSFVEEQHLEDETKHEIGRYTSIEFKDSYYYQIPGDEGFAVIEISNKKNDIFEEIDTQESDDTNYTLWVSMVTNQATRDQLAAKYVGETTVKQATSQPSEKNISAEQNVSRKDLQANNKIVNDAQFLLLAAQGRVKGVDVSLGAPIGPTIENVLGRPDWKQEGEGGYTLFFKNCRCGLGVDYDYDQFPDSPVYTISLPIQLSYNEIIQSLGEPQEEGPSETDSGYYLYYEIGEHALFVNSAGPSSSASFDYITLK